MKMPLERLLSFLSQNLSGCWEWSGRIDRGGYGTFSVRGRKTLAHRSAYELMFEPIPAGKHLDHLCRNRRCCNPLHLEPVSCRENLLRGDTFQARNAAKTHCPAGHEYTPDNTYLYPDGRRRCIACRRIADNMDGPRERRKLHKRQLRSQNRAA